MRVFLFCLLVIIFSRCKKDGQNLPNLVIESNFEQDSDAWISGFADYPVGEDLNYELQSDHKNLPSPLDQSDGAAFISGNNHSDDLFMYLKKRIKGLKSNKAYKARFQIQIASNAPSNSLGVGGAPGEGVLLGIGITQIEPDKAPDMNQYYRMNINKGNQAQEGPDRKIIGNIANGTNLSQYVLLTKTGEFSFTSDNAGKCWAIVSTDSGFEATTSLYYSKITIEFFEIN
jgi:hypothetical protein